MRQSARLFRDNGGTDGDFLCVSPIPARLQHAEHLVPDVQIRDAGAERADHAGKITPKDQWKVRLTVATGAHLPIGTVDACGENIDNDLIRPSGRIRKIAVLQNLRPTELSNVSCLHDVR